jgi:hypothetical protein
MVLGLFGLATGCVAGSMIGWCIVVFCHKRGFFDKVEPPVPSSDSSNPLDKLKNALLTLVLISSRKQDMECNFDYDGYTGDTFPALSGSSVPHACFSYIFNQAEFKQSPMYSAMMAKKMDAINKYLQKNVSTQDQALELFIDFYQQYVEPAFEKQDADYADAATDMYQPADAATDPAEESINL